MKLTGVDLDGGFAELVVTPAKKVHPIPDSLSLKHAGLCEIYTIGVHAMRRTRPEPADTVVILGAGRLGLAVLEVLRQTAVGTIIITDIKNYRLKVAEELGADFTINVLKKDPVEEVMKVTRGRGADKVLEAVGTAKLGKSGKQPMTEAAEMIRPAGRIVVLGQGNEEEPVFWRKFVWKEAEIVASRVSQGEFPRTISMFSRGLFHPDSLITHTLPLDDAQKAFELVESETEEVIKIMFEISGEK
jgi:threonine dehydrogenase-like Zn-dependent dehydrogenase